MSKVILLGDTHWGARNDSQFFLDHFSEFVSGVLIPACREHGVKTIYQLGDLLDRRKYVNFMTLSTIRGSMIGALAEEGISLTALVGNHDTFHKNTLSVNSLDLLFGDMKNFTPVSSPVTVGNLLIIPWICEDNRSQIMKIIEDSSAEYLLGHFELAGFDMYRGVPCEHGDDHRIFSKFKKVYSGHFHTRSGKDNIEYLGTPYEIIWSDFQDEKGFIVLDTETGEETWVTNPNRVHLKLSYDEETVPRDFDFSIVRSKYVKVVVEKNTNQKKLDAFVKMCYSNHPLNLAVIDVQREEDSNLDPSEIIADKDPLTALLDEIKKKPFSEDKINGMIVKSNELYNEAMTMTEDSA